MCRVKLKMLAAPSCLRVNFGFNFTDLRILHKPTARGCINRVLAPAHRNFRMGTLKNRFERNPSEGVVKNRAGQYPWEGLFERSSYAKSLGGSA